MEDDVISIFGIPFFFWANLTVLPVPVWECVFFPKRKRLVEANDHIPPPDFRGKSFRKQFPTLPGNVLIIVTNVAGRDLLTLARNWERFDVGIRNHQPLGGCQVA